MSWTYYAFGAVVMAIGLYCLMTYFAAIVGTAGYIVKKIKEKK